MHPSLPVRSFRTVVVMLGMAFTPTLLSCAQATSAAPTREIVEKAMKVSADKPASSIAPKATLTVDSVHFGAAYPATAQESQVEGIPARSMVTPAVIDYTVRTYYTGETQALHRSREARVFVDKMGDWAVVTGQVKGEDTTTKEPAGG